MALTTIILAKNAEKTIEKCLKSVSWSDEILVIDDESTDQTGDIAKKLGAKVILHALENDFSQQRNVALQQATGDWVLFIDADEVVSSPLHKEILHHIHNPESTYQGFFLLRRDILWGKEIKHGESGNLQLLRLARKNAGIWEGKVHERWLVKGKIGYLQHSLYHYPHPTLSEFLSEINWYTTLRAQELYKEGIKVSWYHIILYPKVKFLQNYILKKGFQDGTIGFILAILMSFHSFLVRGKLWQLQKNK